MNRRSLSLLLAMSMLLLLLLTACKQGGNTDESGSDSGTAADTEAQTAIPRYDYMDAEVSPDVQIDRADYTNLTLTISDSLQITEESVNAYIQNLLFQRRTAVNGTAMVKNQPLKKGDDAYIYYKGFVDGVAFDGGSNWDEEKPHQLGLGSGSFIPGFEDALIGLVPEQTSKASPAEIQVTFPEEYDEALAGKDATFQVVIEYAVQYTIPEYTRAFVEETLKYEPKEEFYASDTALLDEFEEYVRDFLVEQNKTNVENAKIDALWNHLTEKATCKNHPELEVSYYANSYKSEAEYYYDYSKSYYGEQFTKLYPDLAAFAPVYFGFAKDTNWEEELNKMAIRMVERDMITHAIAELEGLETVTEKEFDAQVQYWVDYYLSTYYTSISKAEVIQNMGETFLTESAFAQKLDEWLMKQVTFTFEDGTPVVSNTDNEAESESSEG
jgi:trigger factor